jgi:hypothetical protein
MSGTFMAPIPPLSSLPATHHKRYHARPSTVHDPSPPAPSAAGTAAQPSGPTSLAHDLLAKHAAAKWLQKQRREYQVNRDIRQAKREAAKTDDVPVVALRAPEEKEEEGSAGSAATAEANRAAAFAA